MKTFEAYKADLMDQPSPYLREKLLAQADADGFTAWELEQLAQAAALVWA